MLDKAAIPGMVADNAASRLGLDVGTEPSPWPRVKQLPG
jgi:hypothetical protein